MSSPDDAAETRRAVVEDGQLPPLVTVPPPGPLSRALAGDLSELESPAFDARRAARAESSGADQAPIVYERARGANVWDADGNRYVDLTAGFGALVLGHGPNAATEAARAALESLPLALGDVYASRAKRDACRAIASLFPEPGARVMLGLSGADAVTCALKTALLATGRAHVVAFEGAYHGLSHGPLAACGFSPSFRAPFAAHLGVPVRFAPYPSIDDPRGADAARVASLEAVAAHLAARDVGAVLFEPVLGRGGAVVPPDGFARELAALARDAGALFVLDEIWTGMGRAGALTSCAREGVTPDLLCLGKGLGGGLPISACVGREAVMGAWGAHGGATVHTGTHFGSPPACAAATATLAAIQEQDLAARASRVGDAFRARLSEAVSTRGASVRGRGLMIGVAVGSPARALAVSRALLRRGYIVLTGGASGDVLTLSPPLTIAEPLLDGFARALAESLAAP